jgi:lysophospholipase L1-like esterase
VVKLVKDCQQSGDQNIRLIEGETITSEGNLRDVVHLNIEGAQLFAEQLAAILKTDL